MRTPVLSSLCLLLVALSSCDVTPNLSVIRTAGNVEGDRGDPLKIRRGPQETFRTVRGGFFVVRTSQDWKNLWPAGQEPKLPPTLDTTRQMLVLAVSDSKWTDKVEVRRVLDTGTIVDIYVRETRVGKSCAPKKLADAFDAVVVDRLDKPVRFFVTEEDGESCGDPPIAEVRCRVGETTWWATEVVAQPGDTIDCEMTADSRGRFALVDRSMALAEMPGGSSTKLAYAKGPTRGKFGIDVFGTYVVRGEATDEANRKAHALAHVKVEPPKTKDVQVQLVWAGFDASDEADTFPRLTLLADPGDDRGDTCTASAPMPGVCTAKKHGPYTHMTLAAGDKKIPLSVTYQDERVEKGPFACVHVWFEGKRVAETCDRRARQAGEIWEVGSVELASGTLADAEPARTPQADAGAPAPSAAPAKSKPKPGRPAPAPAPKKK